jgi:hypothetical protein
LKTINPDLLVVEPEIGNVDFSLEGAEYDNVLTVKNDSGQQSITGKPTSSCPSGIVKVSSGNVGVRPQGGKILAVNICKDLLDQMIELKKRVNIRGVDIVFTRVDKGSAQSQCHKNNNILTCADIGLNPHEQNPAKYRVLCEEIDKMPKLDFINEVSFLPKCGSKIYHKTKYRSANHFHVIYTDKKLSILKKIFLSIQTYEPNH